MPRRSTVALATLLTLPASLTLAQPPAAADPNAPSLTGAVPPKSWVDRDTGHRVLRVSDEPQSGAFYFNVNAFTPDGKQMVYNSPSGIMVLDLATMTSKLLVPNLAPPATPPTTAATPTRGRGGFAGRANTIVVGHKTNSIFFTRIDPDTHANAVYKADTNTGAIRKLIDLPPRVSISSVNADETLGAGTYNEDDVPLHDPNAPNSFLPATGFGGRGGGSGVPTAAANAASSSTSAPATSAPQNCGFAYGTACVPAGPSGVAGNAGATPQTNAALGGANVQSDDKGAMMERHLAARTPVVLFTIRLEPGPHGEKPGAITPLLHSTDWIGHMLFSPTDPTLLMYCHEGMWQKVDRIWLIHTDTAQTTLIHKRTMFMEIAGHEFWGLDGKTIWYDWQYPKGEDFFLASYNLETHARTAFHMQRNEWSIHFNLTGDLSLFCGDGGDSGQVAQAPDGEWIELFRPQLISDTPAPGTAPDLNDPGFFQPGVFHSEHLVNMAHQNYRAEPNPRFSPDKKYVFFTSNMFGRSYVFAAEVAKTTDLANAVSTPDLATKYNPIMPTPTTTEK